MTPFFGLSKDVFAVSAILLMLGCSHKDSKVISKPILSTPVPTVVINVQADNQNPIKVDKTPILPKNFWIGFDNSYVLKRFDANGQLLNICDLKSASFLENLETGGVTALSFLNSKTILAFVDPGEKGEQIVAVDVSSEVCTISPWFEPSPNFTNIKSNRIVPFATLNTNYSRVFVAREDGADRFTYGGTNLASRAQGTGNLPFVAKNPNGIFPCVAQNIMSILGLGEGDNRNLLMLSSGEEGTRLNIIGSLVGGASGNPQCFSSIDYAATGQPTNKSDTPIYATTLLDKRVYVLYQNAINGGKLVRYDYNGTQLLAPFLLSQDADDLGCSPKAMTSLTSSSLLIANGRSLAMIDAVSGRLIKPLEFEDFGEHVGALLAEQ